MRVRKQIITPTTITNGKKLNTKQRRENAAIDEAAESWRKTWKNGDPVPQPIVVLHCDIDQQKLEIPHTMMRAYVVKRQARIVGDFKVQPDLQIASDQDE